MVLTYDVNDDGLVNVSNAQRGRSQSYEVDRVFQPDSTQVEVGTAIKPTAPLVPVVAFVCTFCDCGSIVVCDGTHKVPRF